MHASMVCMQKVTCACKGHALTCSCMLSELIVLPSVWLTLAAMAQPATKSARPAGLQAQLPHISTSALSALLKIVKTNPDVVPEAASSRSLRRVRDEDAMVDTPYGKVHQTTSFANSDTAKAPITIEYQHPLAMLYHACMHCACLSNLLGPLAASSSPSKPLSICFYTDEVLPGNPLAVTTDRKLWCFYWSVLEFGSAALSNEEIHTQACMPHMDI